MKRLIGFLMMALLAVTLIIPASPASAAEDALDKIIRTKTFNIGAIPGLSTKLDPNTDEWSGFIPDSLKWVCGQIKVKCKFHKTHWSTFAAGLQAGTFELSAASTFTTPQRAAAVSFLPTLYYLGNGVTTLKKNEGRFKTLGDINKSSVTISTGQGTSQHAWALEVFPKGHAYHFQGTHRDAPAGSPRRQGGRRPQRLRPITSLCGGPPQCCQHFRQEAARNDPHRLGHPVRGHKAEQLHEPDGKSTHFLRSIRASHGAVQGSDRLLYDAGSCIDAEQIASQWPAPAP